MPGAIGGGQRPPAFVKKETDFKAKKSEFKDAGQKLATARKRVADLQKQYDSYQDVGGKLQQLDVLRTRMQDAQKTLAANPGGGQDVMSKIMGKSTYQRDFDDAKAAYDRARATLQDPSKIKAELKQAKLEEKAAHKQFSAAEKKYQTSVKKYGEVVRKEGKEKQKELLDKADRFKERANMAGSIPKAALYEQVDGKRRVISLDAAKAKVKEARQETEDLQSKAHSAEMRAMDVRSKTSRWTKDELHDMKVLKKKFTSE